MAATAPGRNRLWDVARSVGDAFYGEPMGAAVANHLHPDAFAARNAERQRGIEGTINAVHKTLTGQTLPPDDASALYDSPIGFGPADLNVVGHATPLLAGIFAGVKSKTADLQKLRTAKQMELSTLPTETIRDWTGWFRGPDSKWRYEIPDNGLDLRGQLDPAGPAGGLTWTATGFEHRALEAAYPGITAETPLHPFGQQHTPGQNRLMAFFDPDTGAIHLNNGLDAEQMRWALLHELQHKVQGREGFTPGIHQDAPPIRQAANEVMHADRQRALTDMDRYDRALQEWLKARNWTDPVIPHALQLRFLREDPEMAALYTRARQELHRLSLPSTVARERFQAYQRAAGEVEARDVQARMDMQPWERRVYPPYASQNIPRERLLVLPPDRGDVPPDAGALARATYLGLLPP